MPSEFSVEIRGLTKRFGERGGGRPGLLDIRTRGVLLAARPLGVRQDHAAAHDRRVRASDGRLDPDQRRGHDVGAPYERPVNMVFQSYALFPHLRWTRTSRSGCGTRARPGDEAAARDDALASCS